MTGMRRAFLALLLASAAIPASAIPPRAQQPEQEEEEGMIPRWEVVEIAQQLESHAEGVQKILEQVRPKEWIQDEPGGLRGSVREPVAGPELPARSSQILAENPEKLTVVIDTFLWLDRLHSMIGSISGGVRKYQSNPIADLLDSAAGRNSNAIEQLKGYMRQLASHAESESAIAYDEAQRCRQDLLTQPRP